MAFCVCSWQPELSVAIENRESWQYMHSKNTFWLQKYLTTLGQKRSEKKGNKDRIGNCSLQCQIKFNMENNLWNKNAALQSAQSSRVWGEE